MSYFGIVDYFIFLLTLSLSAAIGIYFAFIAKKTNTTDEYLYGSQQMKAIPVGLSLYSSAISAVALLGIPTEVYLYGTQYIMASFGSIIILLFIWYTLLPVFCGNIQIKTPYDVKKNLLYKINAPRKYKYCICNTSVMTQFVLYFEQRFNIHVKMLSLIIYIIYALFIMPITLYAPSIAVSKATGINLTYCTVVICGICIAYTAFGGFKTVIWTDAIQANLMLLSYLVIAIIGISHMGGFSKIWTIADKGDRIEFFNMNPSPLERTTFWTSIIGFGIMMTSHAGCSAGALQRYMSLPKHSDGKISSTIGVSGIFLIQVLGGIIGVVMFATYFNCDPLKNNELQSKNELLPYFVTKTIDQYPGFSGFFFAGIVSAALSSLSSELNVLGGIIYYDFVLRYFKTNFTQTRSTFIIKIIIVINGLIYLCIVPIVHGNAKHIYELAISFGSITYGAKLAMLILGILFPKTNSKGVIIGTVVSMALLSWINYGAQAYKINEYSRKYTSTENCTIHYNTLMVSNVTKPIEESDIFFLYRISYLYYTLVGAIIAVVVAIAVSYMTGPNNVHDINPSLIAPFLRPYYKKPDEDIIENKEFLEM